MEEERKREKSGDKEQEGINCDTVLDYVGVFGWFQKKILFCLSFAAAAGGVAVVVFAFTGFEPNYRCRVKACESLESSSYYGKNNCENTTDNCNENPMLPKWYEGKTIDMDTRCRNLDFSIQNDCFDITNTSAWVVQGGKNELSEQCVPADLVFDRTIMRSTVVEEFGLVCDKAGIRTVVNLMYMIGLLVGANLFGWISDKFGRIKALMLGIMTVSISGL